ncbi:hypothetical protein [Acinetobacter sp. F-1]|uniref:hypothetical protein n=1 Tax=Acinetobacter sp. F-1 TaxID=1796981 RepID=UPI001FD24BFE|nr:hypothetical protein [Acinetobacter sp. F-1]
MAYYAVYDKSSGEIENVVECPEFLAETIHLEDSQEYIQVDSQVSPAQFHVRDGELTKI